jgi:hypothetical protein
MKLRYVKQIALVAALAALTLTAGCHNTSTPTSQSGEFTIVITGSIANTAFQPTINEAQLIFDGTIIVDDPFIPPVSVATLSTSGAAATGSHTVQFAIVAQTSTPNNYTVPAPTVLVYDLNNTLLKTIQLPTQAVSLQTGAAITYNFSL